MADAEIVPLNLVDQVNLTEQIGALYLKGYRPSEIAEIANVTPYKVKQHTQEFLAIIQSRAEQDPYFLERVQYNTLKHLAELDEIGKEAWETVELATLNGMAGTRVQALKLALEITTKKAQLHQLMGSNKSTDSDYLTRMQKSENVNQMLSRILRDVISQCQSCSEKARVLLAEAMSLMEEEELDEDTR